MNEARFVFRRLHRLAGSRRNAVRDCNNQLARDVEHDENLIADSRRRVNRC